MNDILAATDDLPTPTDLDQACLPALEIRGLKKRYAGGTGPLDALKGIDLTVEQGDFFALLGPNGAGKSTTIGVICSLVNKSSGVVKVHGVDIDVDFPLAKQYLGVVPQEVNFNQFEKVIDIVATQGGFYGLDKNVAKTRAERYLKQLGLWEKRFETSRLLSGGMKRRLMIARALVHEPKLLILDEPTAGVDVELRRLMWDFLIELNAKGTTIILTTHYLEEAEQLCRNMAIIDHGEIIERGSIKSLLAKMDAQSFIIEGHQLPSHVEYTEPGVTIVKTSHESLQVDVQGHQSLNGLFKHLIQQGCEITSVQSRTNRLEALFVSLTKESLNAS